MGYKWARCRLFAAPQGRIGLDVRADGYGYENRGEQDHPSVGGIKVILEEDFKRLAFVHHDWWKGRAKMVFNMTETTLDGYKHGKGMSYYVGRYVDRYVGRYVG